jgi:alanine racemase
VSRPTVASVDVSAAQHNLRVIRALVESEPTSSSKAPGVIAVVKANAYGHGAAVIGPALQQAGADMLACADIEEGVLLRQSGVTIPILVFGALSVSDLDGVFDHSLTPTVSTPGAARALEARAAKRSTSLRCHLKIDTGMHRLGFRHDNLRRTMPEVIASPHLTFDAVYTHLATADVPESEWIDEQRQRFDRSVAALGAMGLVGLARHMALSAAILRDTRTWYDYVRPGLLLYGVVPPPLSTNLDLRPALSLTSRIVAVKGLRPGEGTSYGLRWKAEGPRTIAIIPAGYADGLDTRMTGRASVLVRGTRVPVVGAVCMDMLMVDVTGLDVSPGDEVVIIGRQGSQEITAREMAAAIGTMPWEILCRLGARIERRYDTESTKYEVRSTKY